MASLRSKNISTLATALLVSSLLISCFGNVEEPSASSPSAETTTQESPSQGGENQAETEGERDIEAAKLTLEENIRTLNEEDLEAHMATIDEESAVFEPTKATLEVLIKTYDLETEITAVEVVESDADTIKIRAEQITKKISGPEFRDNRLKAVHTLKKRDGKWKISATEIESIEYL